MKALDFNQFLALLFVVCTFTGMFIGLSHDEAYYWIYSLDFSWGHYDHPPMVGWMIKLGVLLWGKSEFGVRFFFNVLQIASIYEIAKLAKVRDVKVQLVSVLIFPMLFAAGFLALPDTPLLYFSLIFVRLYTRFLQFSNLENAVKLGVIIALLFYSKYHGVVIVLFSLLAHPKVFREKHFWTVFVTSFVLFLPHIHWEYSHEFETFRYHLFKRKQRVFEFGNILNYLSGQVAAGGLFAFPIVLLSLIKKSQDPLERILKFNIWGMFGLLLFSALRNKIEANWTISSWGFVSVLLLNFLGTSNYKLRRLFFYLATPSILIVACLVLIFLLPEKMTTKVERIAEFKNWKKKAKNIEDACESKKILANTYQIGAKLNFYTNKKIPVLHHRVRKSEFLHVKDFPVYNENEEICFITYKKILGAKKIEIGFPEEVYVLKKTTIGEIKNNGKTDKF